MKTTIQVTNGYEIKLDNRADNTNTHPFSIQWGSKRTQVYNFRTLKSAEKWAENH